MPAADRHARIACVQLEEVGSFAVRLDLAHSVQVHQERAMSPREAVVGEPGSQVVEKLHCERATVTEVMVMVIARR